MDSDGFQESEVWERVAAFAIETLPLRKTLLLDSSWLVSSIHGSEVWERAAASAIETLPRKKPLLDSSWLLSSIHRFVGSSDLAAGLLAGWIGRAGWLWSRRIWRLACWPAAG